MTLDPEYVRLRTYEAVEQVGRTMTLTSYTEGTYDTETGVNTRTATTHAILASPPLNRTRGLQADTQPRATTYVIVPALNLTATPKVGQALLDLGVYWTVVEVVTHDLAETRIAYELRLAQGAPP